MLRQLETGSREVARTGEAITLSEPSGIWSHGETPDLQELLSWKDSHCLSRERDKNNGVDLFPLSDLLPELSMGQAQPEARGHGVQGMRATEGSLHEHRASQRRADKGSGGWASRGSISNNQYLSMYVLNNYVFSFLQHS